jgi:acyl dehydratase
MSRLVVERADDLLAHAGQEIGVSGWHEVTQEDIDAFARVTGDMYWLHTDPERARDTPFGGTIAHGFFVLSLAPGFAEQLYEVRQRGVSVNYGLDRVRFIAPMPVGGRVRMRLAMVSVDEASNGIRTVMRLTFEREGGEKPVCVADWIGMYLR